MPFADRALLLNRAPMGAALLVAGLMLTACGGEATDPEPKAEESVQESAAETSAPSPPEEEQAPAADVALPESCEEANAEAAVADYVTEDMSFNELPEDGLTCSWGKLDLESSEMVSLTLGYSKGESAADLPDQGKSLSIPEEGIEVHTSPEADALGGVLQSMDLDEAGFMVQLHLPGGKLIGANSLGGAFEQSELEEIVFAAVAELQ